MFAVGVVDPGREQHDTAAHEPVRELRDRVSAEGGDPSAVLRIVDDIELPAGLHLPETYLVQSSDERRVVLFAGGRLGLKIDRHRHTFLSGGNPWSLPGARGR